MRKEDVMDREIFVQEEARKRIERDIDERVAVHKANILRLATAQASATALGVAVRNRPLILLAQGDSWFDYPLTGNGLPLVDTDVIAQLRRIGPMPPTILNLAHHGDAAVDEMSLPNQERMLAALRDPSNWINGKPDAILFSAGGNDIAGDQFCIFLDFNDGRTPGLNADRFGKALGMVEACYLDLFALRDRIAPRRSHLRTLLRLPDPERGPSRLCRALAQAVAGLLQLVHCPGDCHHSRGAHRFQGYAASACRDTEQPFPCCRHARHALGRRLGERTTSVSGGFCQECAAVLRCTIPARAAGRHGRSARGFS